MKNLYSIAVTALILLSFCPADLRAQNVAEQEPNNTFTGQNVPVPYTTNNTGVIVSAGILASAGNDDDYFCFENEFNFQMMRVTIRRASIDGADTLNWEILDKNQTQSESGTIQGPRSYDIGTSGGEKVYVHVDGNPNVNATYEIEVVGIGGDDPGAIAAAAAAAAAQRSKLLKEIKKLKKKIKKASTASKKSKLKAKLRKVKKQLSSL